MSKRKKIFQKADTFLNAQISHSHHPNNESRGPLRENSYEELYLQSLQEKNNIENDSNVLLKKQYLISNNVMSITPPSKNQTYSNHILKKYQHLKSSLKLPTNLLMKLTQITVRHAHLHLPDPILV